MVVLPSAHRVNTGDVVKREYNAGMKRRAEPRSSGQTIQRRSHWWSWWIFAMLATLTTSCAPDKDSPTVVVYASQDQAYAEPILAEFTRRTGIRVRAVYDSEMVKTVGLANRLLAERDRPQCDVFWNNETLRTYQLKERGVIARAEDIAVFGYRSRRLVVNTNELGTALGSLSLLDLTNAAWANRKLALAYPLFGTTATHFLALRQSWGHDAWTNWCRALAANEPLLLDGNSVVVRMVGRGEAIVGCTDSDDIAAGQSAGLPIAALPLTQESLLIPNTASVIAGCPHPEAARELVNFLVSAETIDRLVAAGALEGTDPGQTPTPTLQVNWEKLVGELEDGTAVLEKIFLR